MRFFNMNRNSLPRIDCVVIGVNASATLQRCLQSIKNSSYPKDMLTIIYVDGGSDDDSISIAQSVNSVQTISLDMVHPTPGSGRNAGWKCGSAPLVQFLDSDTILDPDWLLTGVTALQPDAGAVSGKRLEINADKSVYNWIGSLEWNGEPGYTDCFGGDVLIRRTVLEETGGYDEILVGGEDPELSRRVHLMGWKLLQLNNAMTYHDLAMKTVSQYWKRAYRSGYGFAAVVDKLAKNPGSFWKKEFRRILVRGGGSILLLSTALIFFIFKPLPSFSIYAGLLLFTLAIVLLLFPRLFRVNYFQHDKKISRKQAIIYAWHCSLVVIPDIFGVARYYLGKLFNLPLQNHSHGRTTPHQAL